MKISRYSLKSLSSPFASMIGDSMKIFVSLLLVIICGSARAETTSKFSVNNIYYSVREFSISLSPKGPFSSYIVLPNYSAMNPPHLYKNSVVPNLLLTDALSERATSSEYSNIKSAWGYYVRENTADVLLGMDLNDDIEHYLGAIAVVESGRTASTGPMPLVGNTGQTFANGGTLQCACYYYLPEELDVTPLCPDGSSINGIPVKFRLVGGNPTTLPNTRNKRTGQLSWTGSVGVCSSYYTLHDADQDSSGIPVPECTNARQQPIPQLDLYGKVNKSTFAWTAISPERQQAAAAWCNPVWVDPLHSSFQ